MFRLLAIVPLYFAIAASTSGEIFAADSQVFAQVVDGGGWQTTFVLTNRTPNPASASLSFRLDTTGGATQAWNPPFLEVSSTTGLALNAGSTIYLHTPGTAAALSQGWAAMSADAGVVAYAIFTFRNPGRQDQDGTAIASASATRILVPFDNSAGLVTSIGVVNPSGTSQSISVNFRTANGAVTQGSLPNVPPNGHMAFSLPQQFPGVAGQSGLAEFYATSGSFSLLALRFNPTGAFTAAPVYFEAGSPIISSAAPPAGSFGPGVYLVGKSISAGRYYTVPANGCYWQRLSGLGGTLAEIIANDSISPGFEQAIVDIAASDFAFSTNAACGTWFPTPQQGVQATILPGAWLVGTQVAAGTYQANASANCYWERLRDFSGSLGGIIANDFVSAAGPQLVSIAAGDVGFTTNSSCGTWTRVFGQSGTSSPQTPSAVKQNWMMKRSKETRLPTPLNER